MLAGRVMEQLLLRDNLILRFSGIGAISYFLLERTLNFDLPYLVHDYRKTRSENVRRHPYGLRFRRLFERAK